jgi:hypothetical protein
VVIKASHLSRTQDVVEELQEGFVLDFIVCENKCDSLALPARYPVQVFQFIQEISHIVAPRIKKIRN